MLCFSRTLKLQSLLEHCHPLHSEQPQTHVKSLYNSCTCVPICFHLLTDVHICKWCVHIVSTRDVSETLEICSESVHLLLTAAYFWTGRQRQKYILERLRIQLIGGRKPRIEPKTFMLYSDYVRQNIRFLAVFHHHVVNKSNQSGLNGLLHNPEEQTWFLIHLRRIGQNCCNNWNVPKYVQRLVSTHLWQLHWVLPILWGEERIKQTGSRCRGVEKSVHLQH